MDAQLYLFIDQSTMYSIDKSETKKSSSLFQKRTKELKCFIYLKQKGSYKSVMV